MARLLVFDGFVFISATVLFGFLLGLNRFLTRHGDNGCEMTYMYEYPQFVRVALPLNVTAEYRRYGLYAYSEGRHTQQARNMQFSGIPVLFIPGQGGSLKQGSNYIYNGVDTFSIYLAMRSLASVSLRKALGSDHHFHFDFFTLDLNEEYSAMFGGVLADQTRFTVYAVQRVLSLYRGRPDSIVLVGHSMGGMIAKGLFLEEDFPSEAVRLVVTLATPYSPVLLTDPLLRDYYHRVTPHHQWAPSANVTVISLGGGNKDLVVRSGLTLTNAADISALTTAVSEVWMSVDHLCILWCKQLVLVLVRALFDCVDLNNKQISEDPQFRLDVFNYHLLERSAGKQYSESRHPEQTTLQTGRSEWVEMSRPHLSLHRRSLQQPLHLLVHLPPGEEDTLAIATLGHKARDWLFACTQITTINGGRRVCTVVENLSSMGRIAPTRARWHKTALVNIKELRARRIQYVVIRLPPSDEPTSLNYDVFRKADRNMVVDLPRWGVPQWSQLLEASVPGAAFYSLDLPQVERPWQAYHLSIRTINCTNITHQAVATFRVPWSHQHYSTVLKSSSEMILPIMLHTSRPTDWSGADPYVTLHLEPSCRYSVHIQSSAVDSLAQLVRLYWSQLLAYVAAILLLTLRRQLMSLGSDGHCLLFHHALLEGAKPYYVLPAVKITSNILSWQGVPPAVRLLVPSPDASSLTSAGQDLMLLPMLLYAVAFALTFLLGLLAYAAVVCSGSTVNKFALKFVGKLAGVSRTWTDWLMAAVDKVPFVVAAAMVAILFSSCGGLAMVIGTVYYFMKVCGMYEDYIEQLFFAPVKFLKDTVMARWKGRRVNVVDDALKEAEELLSLRGLTEFNFHLTVGLLWGTSTLVHLPSVLVWAHNFKYNPVLEPDPATSVALVSSACAAVLWTLDTPATTASWEGCKLMSNVMLVLACLVLMYCPVSLYNLPVLTTVALLCLAGHQLYERARASRRRPSESEPEPELVPILDEDRPAIVGDEDSSTEESDESERAIDNDDSILRNGSKTPELTMSSYKGISLAEVKGTDTAEETLIKTDESELENESDEEDSENDCGNEEKEEEEEDGEDYVVDTRVVEKITEKEVTNKTYVDSKEPLKTKRKQNENNDCSE